MTISGNEPTIFWLVAQCLNYLLYPVPLQVVVVFIIVDWDGLPVCCDVCGFFRGWRHLRKGCWSLYVEYELLHTGVHLLWLWEFWIGISAWRIDWTSPQFNGVYKRWNTGSCGHWSFQISNSLHAHLKLIQKTQYRYLIHKLINLFFCLFLLFQIFFYCSILFCA